ncbi:MAG: HAMP domain-containing sensor histidine kinase [Gemmatimonadota bacterium]
MRLRSWWLPLVSWATLYLALALLLAWARDGTVSWLVAAGVATIASTGIYVVAGRRLVTRNSLLAVLILLGLGQIAAGVVASRLRRIGADWDTLQSERAARTRRALDQRIAAILDHGRAVSARAATMPFAPGLQAFQALDALQAESNVDAIALFGEQGELLAWTGEHRGKVPDQIRVRDRPVKFIEGPLYSYLYFSTPRTQRPGHAVVGILLDAALPADVESRGVAAQIEQLAGRNASFVAGSDSTADWSLKLGEVPLLYARLDPLTQSEWRHELLQFAQRLLVLVGLSVLLILAASWFREPTRPQRLAAFVPYLGTIACVFAAPIGATFDLDHLFSPGVFLFPGPGDISLGSLLAAMVLTGVFVSTTRARYRWPRSGIWFVVAAVLISAALPFAVYTLLGPTPRWLEDLRAHSPTLMQGGWLLWAGLQTAVTLLVAVGILGVLLLARLPARLTTLRRQRTSYLLIIAAVAASSAWAVVIVVVGRRQEQVSPLLSLLWVGPIILAGLGAAAYQRDGRRIVRWLCSGWLAATVMLPYLWTAQLNARMRSADRDLTTLGNRADPFLGHLLRQFGLEAIARRERGEDGLQLLYRSWVSSGLAHEAFPARIMLWGADGKPEVKLPLGDAYNWPADRQDAVPPYLSEYFVNVRELAYPEVVTAYDVENVNQVLVVPLYNGRMITVEVPPRRSLERSSVIAPILGTAINPGIRLELVRARARVPPGNWRPSDEGWRKDELVTYNDGAWHAHLVVRTPQLGVLIARGVLIISADLVLFLVLWLAGRALRGENVVPRGGWFGWLASFRARVTAALFIFFLLPTVTFGYVAYRALAQEVARAAQIVAERAVTQAVVEFPDVDGDLLELSDHAGAELLLYFQGEPTAVSAPEALELGVYNGWMPSDVFYDLETEEEVAISRRVVANQQFITAFRRLQVAGTGVMAVPFSLQSSESIIRQREMAHLILFAALMGGVLSLVLSLAVGRALAGPIGRLQRAAAAVGAGRLRVQLPEQTGDEFGRLYASFNRMVRRLQRARAQELRTTRVLAWGEMARQVAHEIKNPLTPIKLAVQHLRRAYADRRGDFEQVLDQNVDQILVEIDRLSDIARAFSRYGAPAESAGPLEPVNVAAVVNEALTLYRAGDPHLDYIDDLEPGLPRVLARAGELKEVLLNLLENARAATTPPGRIAVTGRHEGNAVELCIEDSGMGIPADMLQRVFEPHFSTRSTGTGLGLPIVRRLIESWGGTVEAQSEAGRGTVIRVRLTIAALESD